MYDVRQGTLHYSNHKFRPLNHAIVGIMAVLVASVAIPTYTAGAEGAYEGGSSGHPEAPTAEQQKEYDDLRAKLSWAGYVEGRGIAPYAGMPGEVTAGTPYTGVILQVSPAGCESLGGEYYPSWVVEDGFLGTTGYYKNPTMARALFPAAPGGGPTASFSTAPGGPAATAECPGYVSGKAASTYGGYVSEQAAVSSANTMSTADVTPDGVFIEETLSSLKHIKIGDLEIAALENWLKVELAPGEEPKVSYRTAMSGITTAGQVSGVTHDGFVIAGNKLAGPEIAQQFASQANAHGKTLSALSEYGIQLFEPRVQTSADAHKAPGHTPGPGSLKITEGYFIDSAVIDAKLAPSVRRAQYGDHSGMRLGHSRANLTINRL